MVSRPSSQNNYSYSQGILNGRFQFCKEVIIIIVILNGHFQFSFENKFLENSVKIKKLNVEKNIISNFPLFFL